jgi:hypothetical protein
MAILFDEILAKGIRAGQIPAQEQKAREWYRDVAKDFKNVNASKLMRGDKSRLTSRSRIGSMYMFYYDAKHKETLPYWDRFPFIFPFKKMQGGFLGINLHYLPHPLRAKLMDSLYDLASDERYDEKTRLKLSYDVLNSASRFKYFKPCIKHYLTGQLKSRFLYVYPSEWDVAMFLPLERFEKAGKRNVWSDSRKAI